jgi:protein-L-isoaspartate(D-aspartate) O-methyltransferase
MSPIPQIKQMDLQHALDNMIEQQIRTWDVLDTKVLNVLRELPRERFVPDEIRRLAYSDTRIPLPCGQQMMTPKVEARMLQALAVGPGDNVLEIGTGSGYVAALLARLAGAVTSVEYHAALSNTARERLDAQSIPGVELEVGDALHGWADSAPYDIIAVTGSLADFDEQLDNQLNIGGRMFVIVGRSPVMTAYLVTRLGDENWSRESLFETDLQPLIGVPEAPRFRF